MTENQDLDYEIQESPLKARREELGLSQREVASAVDVSVQTISNWETGRYKEAKLTLPQVKALCQLMKWTVDDLPDDFRPRRLSRKPQAQLRTENRQPIAIPKDESMS